MLDNEGTSNLSESSVVVRGWVGERGELGSQCQELLVPCSGSEEYRFKPEMLGSARHLMLLPLFEQVPPISWCRQDSSKEDLVLEAISGR